MIANLLAALALLHAGMAPAKESCVTPSEAEALTVVLLPDVLEAVGRRCEAALPAAATLRSGLAPLSARWRAEGAPAQADAAAAVGKLMGDDLKGGDPAAMLSLVRTALVNELVDDVKPAACPQVDRAVVLASPLPARNIAGLFVMLAEIGGAGTRGGGFQICKLAKP